jgi:trimeric autotransporter adhesin
MQWMLRLSSAVVVCSTLVACGGGGSGSPAGPATVAAVRVTAPANLFEKDSVRAQATAFDASGSALAGRTITWSSSNIAVAIVSSTGVVSGVASGTATIVATSEGKSGSADVTVTRDPAVASVTLTPLVASIPSGGNLQLTVAVKNAHGQDLPNQAVSYATSNAAVATVSSAGVVASPGPAGTANIVASVGSMTSAPLALTVTPGPAAALAVASGADQSAAVGATLTVSVKLTDSNGNPIAGQQVTFSFGSGSTSGVGIVPTDANGIAVFNRWMLQTKGENDLLVNSGTVPQLIIKATGT